MTTALNINDELSSLSGVGPKRLAALAEMGISRVGDLLHHFPRRYEDRTNVTDIADAVESESITIRAEVVSIRNVRLRGRKSLAEATLKDATGEMRATWFGQGYLARSMPTEKPGYFTGTVGKYNGLCLKNPDFEFVEEGEAPHGIVPVYTLADGISQRQFRSWMETAIEAAGDVVSTIPEALERKYGFPAASDAIRAVHFPETVDAARAARERFAYEELLSLQIELLRDRATRKSDDTGIVHRPGGPAFAALRQSLPFKLTGAQDQATGAIIEDMASPRPMFRLLQGDVGCGKTIVAAHALATAHDGGYQAAVMAPTAILADQHFSTLRRLLEPIGINVGLLTGSTPNQREVRAAAGEGHIDVLVGTHALFESATEFKKLGFVIVDEQHRFGVVQRDKLAQKGTNPDILQMTATPIPRTLAHTVYGAMDLTIIDELPPGRTPVKTRKVPAAKVEDMHRFVVNECQAGAQAYYVCPLVEESEQLDLASVTATYAAQSSEEYAGLRTALIHGRMPPAEKDDVMTAFSEGAIDIIFATSVIEVGVDVPNARIMIIEDAHRFGLTQLHQLRGRIGRGGGEAYCFLLGKPTTPDGRKRIEAICKTTDGFALAETDLELRGPGEFRGVRQAGLSDLRFADLLRDARLLDAARKDALGLCAYGE